MSTFDERLEMLHTQIRRNVEQHGWHFTAVFPDENDGIFFGYTTGLLHSYQHPELVIFGVRPQIAHAIVAAIVQEHIRDGRVFGDGERVGGLLRDGFDVFFRTAPCDDPEFPLSASTNFYASDNVAALQVVLPDDSNLFPWEDGVAPGVARTQNVLMRDN